MPVDWKKPEAYNRLLAAVVAANGANLNYRSIAAYYGQGATYDAIEGRFRIIKADAKILKSEFDEATGQQQSSSPNTPTKTANPTKKTKTPNATPRKSRGVKTETPTRKSTASGQQGVLSGRVTKANGSASTGKAGGKKNGIVKVEGEMGDAGDSFTTYTTTTASSSFASNGAGVANEFQDMLDLNEVVGNGGGAVFESTEGYAGYADTENRVYESDEDGFYEDDEDAVV